MLARFRATRAFLSPSPKRPRFFDTPMTEKKPFARMHLWLETEDGLYFCLGRAMLLELIDQHGSLKKAAEELGMSYRAAWGKVKKTEEVLGAPLIERTGNRSSGYKLTEFGRSLTNDFKAWREAVQKHAMKSAKKIFGGTAKNAD
jgi:molybdate transport system regulatory protein